MQILPKSRRLRRLIKFLCVAVFAPLILLAAAVGLKIHWPLSRAIHAHYADLRQAHRALTWEECTRSYRSGLAKPENAALEYQSLFWMVTNARLFTNYTFATRFKSAAEIRRFTDEERNSVKKLLNENQRVYENIPRCIAKEHGYFELEWEQGLAMSMRHVAQIGDVQRLIEIHGLFASQSNDAETVLEDVRRLILVSDSLGQEPTIISALARIRGRVAAYRIAGAALGRLSFTDGDLTKLATEVESDDTQEQWVSAFDVERREWGDIFESSVDRIAEFIHQISYTNDFAPSRPLLGGVRALRVNGALKRDYLFFLNNLRALQEAIKMEGHESFETVRQIDKTVQEDRRKVPDRAKSFYTAPEVKVISGMCLPACVRGLERWLDYRMEKELLRTAIAAKRFERTKNRWPVSLNELTPDYLVNNAHNPLTGRSFELEPKNGGLLIIGERPVGFPTLRQSDSRQANSNSIITLSASSTNCENSSSLSVKP